MSIARITQETRKTTQSGKAKAGRWLLEMERSEAMRPDPVTGWSGSGDTETQLKIWFDSADEAIAYCTRRGIDYHLVKAAPHHLKLQAYADNFR